MAERVDQKYLWATKDSDLSSGQIIEKYKILNLRDLRILVAAGIISLPLLLLALL